MTHKGEYYTDELKGSQQDNLDEDDEDVSGALTEVDLLGENRRTEHFV